MSNKQIDYLNWRYATKSFDNTKKVSSQDIDMLVNSALLSPSSYGLQPYKLLVISDLQTRKKLFNYSFNQDQVLDCSHIFLFCIENSLDENYVDSYIDDISNTRNVPKSSLEPFRKSLLSAISNMGEEKYKIWAYKQVYIALGILINNCAIKKIDSCPMEGFEAKKYDEVLELDKKNIQSVVMATVGYRKETDDAKYFPKVRKSKNNFLIEL